MDTPYVSLLAEISKYPPTCPAITDLETGQHSTFGDLAGSTLRFVRSLARFGLHSGATVSSDVKNGFDVAALILACLENGLNFYSDPSHGAARSITSKSGGSTLIVRDAKSIRAQGVRQIDVAELGRSPVIWDLPDSTGAPTEGAVSALLHGTIQTFPALAVSYSIENMRSSLPIEPGQTMLSLGTPDTLDGIVTAILAPLTLGLHVILADPDKWQHPGLSQDLPACDWCVAADRTWLALARADTTFRLPVPTAEAFCSSGALHPNEAAEVEAGLGFPVRCGLGTVETGLWAISASAVPGHEADRYIGSIRPLRSRLNVVGANQAAGGEIILRDGITGLEHRTGLVGWSSPLGQIEMAGLLSNVIVRAGTAAILSDTDRLLSSHPAVSQSRTFRETGLSPTEKSISVCLTSAEPAELDAWLKSHAVAVPIPNRLVTVSPERCSDLPRVEVLREIVSGRAGHAIISALTSRRFRRNPAYDEAGLAAAVNRALLADQPLEFLMFWGCGPRRVAAAPDRAAVDALAELLAAAEAAAPIRARAHIVCTDLHATNNGHSEAHYSTYFGEIAALAAGLDVSFELESAVWSRGGLSKSLVCAYEQEAEFAERWTRFPLQTRFVQQASRHSGMVDKVAAARHYYATCLLERDVLKTLFSGFVFLTYNGPEFNECFPDLPTLYIFPGPRGRTVKPWFVDTTDDPPLASPAPAVAAE